MNKKLSGRTKAVFNVLPSGSGHPITAKEIHERLNVPMRDVYEIINTLIIVYNIPIGGLRSDNKHGYFIITNERERHEAVDPLAHHANEIMLRVNKIKQINLSTLSRTQLGDDYHEHR